MPDSSVLDALQTLRQAKQRLWTAQWRKRAILTREFDRLVTEHALLTKALQTRLHSGHSPTLQYEKMRRKLQRNVLDLWEYFKHRIETTAMKVDELNVFWVAMRDHKRFLLKTLQAMTASDEYEAWRNREAAELADYVQGHLRRLQDPTDCDKRKILGCRADGWNCGWGCQAHHMVECVAQALGMGRTLIYNVTNFKYGGGESFQRLFQGISPRNCGVADLQSYPQLNESRTDERVQVFDVKIAVDANRAKFIPAVVPLNLLPRIARLTDQPAAWWSGQLYKFALRPTEEAQRLVQQRIESLGMDFSRPIVGLHVRRTDKVLEAFEHPIDEYMMKADEFYDSLEAVGATRRIYVATDDYSVVKELKAKYAHYEILSNEAASRRAFDPQSRYSFETLLDILTDMEILQRCDFVVCTFSSNVCRNLHELRMAHSPESAQWLVSLDTAYHSYNQRPQLAEIVAVSRETRRLGLRIGERVVVSISFQQFGQYFVRAAANQTTSGYLMRFFAEAVPDAVPFPLPVL